MAKYSTSGSGGGGEGDACELCGQASGSLREANVAGAELLVCPDCAPHDDAAHKDRKKSERSGNRDQDEESRERKAVRNEARTTNVWDGDTSHWESEGTNYDSDPLPYLVSDYGDRLVQARQDAGFQREELADELGVPESDLLAIEQGRATRAGIGGSLIADVEEFLDVALSEESE